MLKNESYSMIADVRRFTVNRTRITFFKIGEISLDLRQSDLVRSGKPPRDPELDPYESFGPEDESSRDQERSADGARQHNADHADRYQHHPDFAQRPARRFHPPGDRADRPEFGEIERGSIAEGKLIHKRPFACWNQTDVAIDRGRFRSRFLFLVFA